MEWNVLISVQDEGYSIVRKLMHEYGRVHATEYFNVMVMQVHNIDDFLEDMATLYEMKVAELAYIGRMVPVSHLFTFQSPDDFESKAREIVANWVPLLAGKHFYVRMHRRGFKGRLSSQEEEHFLDGYILGQLQQNGLQAAKVSFSEADFVIAIETVGQQAGLSLWSSEQIARFPFLKLD